MLQTSEILAAVEEAEITIRRANNCVSDMAKLCAGRLRESTTPPWALEKLKRELANYNIKTMSWKD